MVISLEGAVSGTGPVATGDAQLSPVSTSQAHTVPEDGFLLCAEMTE